MICGLLGEKLSHSYSPQIHQRLGNYEYKLFEKEPEELKDFLNSNSFHGINVTIPYKKAVIPFCSSLTPQAEALGAVNTIVRQQDGTLIGHNTDYYGFQQMANRLPISYAEKKVLILGSGGASNTARAVMKKLGAKVVVISRNGQNNYQNLSDHKDCSVIINATPVGMYPHSGVSPIDLSIFPALEGVLDLIYNPANTRLLMDAQSRGIQTENGLYMLVAQAKESSEWFTGKKICDDAISQIHAQLKFQMENIILIGMPGCGKSTVGQIIAERLGREFIDADSWIEKAAGCSIPEFFSKFSESEFRKLETQILSDIGKKSGAVIATGGGCVIKSENYPLLHQNGTIFWIQREISQLSTEGRPLSQSQKLEDMYAFRYPLYDHFSDYTVQNNTTCQNTATEIMKILENSL